MRLIDKTETDFNSSMVRLKAELNNAPKIRASLFQFQYCAIESFGCLFLCFTAFTFQFQYGAIERIRIERENEVVYVFQFQYGAIER